MRGRPTASFDTGTLRTGNRKLPAAGVVALFLLPIAACGDDDGAAATAAADSQDGVSAHAEDGCVGTALEFTNFETGVSGTATSALATSGYDGAVYVAHAADFDLDADDLSTWRPEVPAGSNVITVQLTIFNATEELEPVGAGATLRWTTEPGELTYALRHFTTDDDWSDVEVGPDEVDEAGGELTVTGVGESFCFEIDHQDPQKAVSGTVDARVFEERGNDG